MIGTILDPEFLGIEFIAFVSFALLIEFGERVAPAHVINRRRHLKLDLLGAFFLVFFISIARRFVTFSYSSIELDHAVLSLWDLSSWPSVVKVSLAFVVSDFNMYWIHRAMHRFPILWKTHIWHHSIENLYWFSGLRSSFFHVFLFACSQIFVAFYLFQLSAVEAGIAFGIGVFCQFYTHTSWNFNLGPLKYVFVTPAFHRVHHSRDEHQRRNFGVTLSVWDHLLGTYFPPENAPRDLKLGPGEGYPTDEIPTVGSGRRFWHKMKTVIGV